MISKVIKGQSLSFSHLGGLLKVSLSNVPSSAAKLMVLTPGYVTSKNMPVQGWSGSFTEDKPYVQAYAGEDGLIGVSFTPGTSSYMDFYVPLPVGPGVTHTYPEIRIYLVDSAGSTISGTLRAAADVRIDRQGCCREDLREAHCSLKSARITGRQPGNGSGGCLQNRA